MASREDSDIDDDFSELYKEYTGPLRSNTTSVPETTKPSKRSHADSDEEEQETLDPNAVPTDFTSRDAKVWEAKSKATERNWKKRKEEEMICKLCGDSSHYTQGCPSTLGASRKSQDLFLRVPARGPQVKSLFTEWVVKQVEKDVGCKIKIEKNFIIVSGKDGRTLSKGVDAVHKIKNEGSKSGELNPILGESNSRSPKGRIHDVSKKEPTDSQRSNHSPRNPSDYDQRSGRQDKVIKEHVREEFQKHLRRSPQAYGNDGIQGRSTHSQSPARRASYTGGLYDLNDNHKCGPGPNLLSGLKEGGHSTFTHTLEELELEYKRDAINIAKIRDNEEDEENYRHREAINHTRINYMTNLATIREMHRKQWEEFLQLETRRRQQETHQQMLNAGFGGDKDNNHYDYDVAATAGGGPYINSVQMESRVRYPEVDNYLSLRSNNNFDDFQHQRHEDYRDAYNRNNSFQ
ncbi:hypothetical protein E3N88_11481 [Mikania micrantha]|uniref:CCHC-type domain-containing protein n=1 Tax=Mikania micrantha TaxID=192012 RepID=A0A5N6PDI0_9ASTR|nr:hypothetical protein E3N88_11481 [Mikania micrantha]